MVSRRPVERLSEIFMEFPASVQEDIAAPNVTNYNDTTKRKLYRMRMFFSSDRLITRDDPLFISILDILEGAGQLTAQQRISIERGG